MRNALKFVSRKDRKVGTADLQKIDRALMAEDVEQELLTRTEIRVEIPALRSELATLLAEPDRVVR